MRRSRSRARAFVQTFPQAFVCTFFLAVSPHIFGHIAVAQVVDNDDYPWTRVTAIDSDEFSYLFYSEADNQNNGIVVKLTNTGVAHISYSFTIVFRTAGGVEHAEKAAGNLLPGEAKTGDSAGLFWIPFGDGRPVYEVGFRGVKIAPLERSRSR